MANPEYIDKTPAALEAYEAAVTKVRLNPAVRYLVYHDGITPAGLASTTTVWLNYGNASEPVAGSGPHRGRLIPGRIVPIGPGVEQFLFRTATGDGDIAFTVFPQPV
jgi:hypothetical protein